MLLFRYKGVVAIVKEKIDSAKFSAMLSLFMKRACSLESQRVARLVGNIDDDESSFRLQARQEFDKLLKIQE